MKSMDDLFLHFLQDVYYAEKAAGKSLTKIAKMAEGEEFKSFIADARERAKEPVEKLDQVFEAIGKRPRGKTCAAMNGLIEEVEELISEGEKGPTMDAGLIAGMQGMAHYIIARLGTMATWAKHMDAGEAEDVLNELVESSKEDDRKLTEIAEAHANAQSEEEEGEEDEDEDDEEDDEDEEPEEPEEPKQEEKPAPAPKRAPRKK